MGDDPRHYRTDRPGESSVGYARNDRDRPFGKRDGWLGPPGYSRGSHPPAAFTHRRGRFDPSHVGSREYAAPDRLQPVRPSFPGRGVPPPYHYTAGGPRRGHGVYGGIERGRPYHLSEPRSSVYNSEPFSPVPSGRAAHRDNPHDWDSNREGPSGWDVDRDPPAADWSRGVGIQPAAGVSAVRAPLRAGPRYAVADVEAGELPSDAVRGVKTSQWDKGGPLQRAPLQSPNSVQSNHNRVAKVIPPFTAAALTETQSFSEQSLTHDVDTVRTAAVVEEPARPSEPEQLPVADVKLEPRNAEVRPAVDVKLGEESNEKPRADAADGEFPSPAPTAGEEYPRAGRRRGWGQGLKRLSSTSVKPENKGDDPAANTAPQTPAVAASAIASAVFSFEEAEKGQDAVQSVNPGQQPGQECPAAPDLNVDTSAAVGSTAVLVTEPSEDVNNCAAGADAGGAAAVSAGAAPDMAGIPATPSAQSVPLSEPVPEPPAFSKAEILMSIEGVDSELGELEKQLASLNKQVADLVVEQELAASLTEELSKPLEFTVDEEADIEEVQVIVSSDESDFEEEESEENEHTDTAAEEAFEMDTGVDNKSIEEPVSAAEDEVTWRNVVDKVLRENQAAADCTHNAVSALSCPVEAADGSSIAARRAFASTPETVAQLNELVKQFLLERHKLVTMKQQALANEYLTQEEQYVGRLDSQAAVAGTSGRKPQEPSARATRSSHHASDSVRSELEYKLVLQQRQAISDLEEMTKLPDYLLDPWQKRWKTFNNRNNLVEDPERELEEDKMFKENWTNMEKRLFRELFLLHPKDFGAISEHMEGRSTGDCVIFFYKTQKLDEFAAVRRKQQLKKRRLQCESKRHAVPLSYAPAAKASLEGRRGRGRAGGRGRGRGAAAAEVPVPEPEESDTKPPPKLEVSRLEKEDSIATDEMNGVVKESPSGMYAEGGRGAMSPNPKRQAVETPRSSVSPSGRAMSEPQVKSAMSPSSHRSPTAGLKTSGGPWTSFTPKTSIEPPKPAPPPLLTPLPPKSMADTPKPAPMLLTPLPPQSDPPKPAVTNLLTPLPLKSPSHSEPVKVLVTGAPSPGPRMASEPTTPASAAGREQIPGLTYTNYSAWDEKEFVKAVHMFGNDPYKISDYLGTKTVGAVKMYFSRNKKRLGLENVQTVRRNPYADDAGPSDPPLHPPLDLQHPLVATLKAAAAVGVTTPHSLLNLAMPPPMAAVPPAHPNSTLLIAPLSPLPAAPSSSSPDVPAQHAPTDNATQNTDPQAGPTNTQNPHVSLFQPATGGPSGIKAESNTNISDLLLLQGDNFKHSLPDLSSLFSLNAFQSGAGSPGSAGGASQANLLTSLPGLPLGRTVSASAPSLFTNQPYQRPNASEPGPSNQPARQLSASYAVEAVTPRGSEDTIAAVPTTGRGRAANLWSSDEKERFLDAFKRYGKIWQRLQEAVPSKSMAQIKTYYQNYKTKLGLDKMEVPPVPKFEAAGGGSKRRHGGNKANVPTSAGRDVSVDAEAAAPVAHSSYLQEAVRAWDASKESSLPSWPALNVKQDEAPPTSSAPSQHAPSQSPHHSHQTLPHLTNQPSPFTMHRGTPPPQSAHPQPPVPPRPDSRDGLATFPVLDPTHLAAAALAQSNSAAAGMDSTSLERLDSMLAAYIRSLPDDTGLKLTSQQWQQLMNSAASASGQSLSATPQEPPAQAQAQPPQQQQQQQQQQKLPPVPPLLQQLEDVRVLGHNIHVQPPASASASALPIILPRAAPAPDLVTDRRDQHTNALLALLGKGSIPLGALSQQHSILPPPQAPVTSAAVPRLPLLDAAAALSSLGLSSMYSAAAAAAGLPPSAGADMLSSLAHQTLLASSNRSSAHLSPLSASALSQPAAPAALDYLSHSQLHSLPLQLLGSLNLPHSSAESALLALASASSQQPPQDNPPYNTHGSSANGLPARAPTPKALDLQTGESCQADNLARSSSAPNQPRKMTDLNVGPGDSVQHYYELPSSSMGPRLAQDPMSERSHSTAASNAASELESAVHMYYPPAKRARYEDMQYDQDGSEGHGNGRRESFQDVATQQQLAAVTLLTQQPPSLTSAAQMMLQLAAGGLQLRESTPAGTQSASAMAAVAAAAGRDAPKPVSRQFMEAELARYMQGSFHELDLSANHAGPNHPAQPQDFRDANLPPQPPTSILGLEPMHVLTMLSGKKPDHATPAGLLAPPSLSAGSVSTVARQLASLPPESRSSLILTNPELLHTLPFHGLQARSATPPAQAVNSSTQRTPPNPLPQASDRILSDMAGVGGTGLAAMQMREAGSVMSAAHLPQWLAGVAGPGLSAGAGGVGAGLDLNRMAPSTGTTNSTLPPTTIPRSGPPAGRSASSSQDHTHGGT